MRKTPNFAIVGGGIGGLTLAIALQKKGLKATVYEHAAQLKALGAGISLAANAMKAFAEIGIDHDILGSGRVLKKLLIKDERGKVLTETDAEQLSRKLGRCQQFCNSSCRSSRCSFKPYITGNPGAG